MALVCPVGHPPGVGTQYCRLCGRAYIESADLPADSQLAMLAAQRETLDQVRAAVAPAAALPVPPPSPAPSAPPAQAPPAPPPVPESYAPVQGTGAPADPPRMVPPPPGAPPLRTTPPEPGAPLVPAQPAAPPAQPGGLHLELPLVQTGVPVPMELPPAVPDEVEPVQEEKPTRRDRGVLLLATVAGFVGGAISGAGVQYLLG